MKDLATWLLIGVYLITLWLGDLTIYESTVILFLLLILIEIKG